MKTFSTTNPATGEVIEELPFAADDEIPAVLDRAQQAFTEWAARPIEERAAIVKRVSELFTQKADELAQIATQEMGKPIGEMLEETEFCADIFNYYATNGPKPQADQVLSETD